MMKTKTYGLTHIALAIKNTVITRAFYTRVFDMEVMYHQKGFLQLSTPGCNDIVVFEEKEAIYGSTGGITHFGFRLREPEDIALITAKVIEAGGDIVSQGEFVPGSPFIFFRDPDGYEVEVWYEKLPDSK